jgi:hypothetical protein
LPYLALEPLPFSLTDGRTKDYHRDPGRLPFSYDSCPKAVSNMAFELVKLSENLKPTVYPKNRTLDVSLQDSIQQFRFYRASNPMVQWAPPERSKED